MSVYDIPLLFCSFSSMLYHTMSFISKHVLRNDIPMNFFMLMLFMFLCDSDMLFCIYVS